jgi:hypothetical protein
MRNCNDLRSNDMFLHEYNILVFSKIRLKRTSLYSVKFTQTIRVCARRDITSSLLFSSHL